jgi:hypothetical protein
MKIARKLAAHPMLFTTLFLTMAWFSASPTRAAAQQGDNAVWTTNTSCCSHSAAFIDASVLTGTDICAKIFNAIGLLPSTGGVVDARGISTGLTCTTDTPWVQSTSTTVPADILLPTGTITIGTTWVLPNHTRIIGTGTGSPNTSGTVITAASGFSGAMIQMGSSATGICGASAKVCNGVAVENLMLNGANQAVTGILNENSEELSYVNHVNLYQIIGTGLDIETSVGSYSAGNSGPYSNISFSPGSSAATTTVCAKILGARTRGIHGLTCVADGTPTAAILLDADNNSIEDVHMEGFVNGIFVGDNAPAASNILFNITGSIGGGAMTNVIHISNANTVADLSILDVESENIAGKGSPTNSIKDDVTGTTLTDTTVGMYALGETVGTSGVSRFTTSPNAVTWGVGSSAPTGTCLNGSIFSDTGGTTHTFYVCQSSGWVGK